jgi:hypothetical protein
MNEDDQYIEDLILNGALEPGGIDPDTGEMLYNFTEKLQELDPRLHDEFQNYFAQHASALWEKGFLEMNVTEKDPIITLTDKAFDKDSVESLDSELQYSLREIIRLLLY